MTRRRKAYRPMAPERLNMCPVTAAIRRAEKLSAADVLQQRAIAAAALAALTAGVPSINMGATQIQHDAAEQHWRSLADQANMAETLASMGLGRGADADRIIGEAQQALAAICTRRADLGYWQATEHEADALAWLATLHGEVQIPAVSYGEFERAFHATRNRLQQAMRGNASPNTVVVAGDFARATEVHA